MKRRKSPTDHKDAADSKRRGPFRGLPLGIAAAMAFGCLALAPLTMLLFGCFGVDVDPLLAVVVSIVAFMALLIANRIRRRRRESKLPKEDEGDNNGAR
jgi:hypothetical protein